MSSQIITSDLLMDLSIEEQQLLSGGKKGSDDDDDCLEKCLKDKGCWKKYKKCYDKCD
ncbi:hypothetical protein [Calothrix sp. PCC 7507]|uniref:hypothetical protein n=1 Tax=Calothrix sp. PCC 7507 TaxID=99598 RepID=UPI00029F2875|nr:hypothetical protein [Calothrix sp. PCC 7507]AFY32593.1 hypothetical protein Cal7507_2151 [Calothrix sp. PCC 7507]